MYFVKKICRPPYSIPSRQRNLELMLITPISWISLKVHILVNKILVLHVLAWGREASDSVRPLLAFLACRPNVSNSWVKLNIFIHGRRPRHTILIGYEISSTHRLQSNWMAFVTNFIGTNGSSGFDHVIKLLSLKLMSKIKNAAG